MSNYIEVSFLITPASEAAGDVLSAYLADISYESFVTTPEGITAYVQEKVFDKNILEQTIGEFPLENLINYDYKVIETKNWNEEWEKNYFQPIIIGNDCVIHSTFHTDVPVVKYDIVIDPKMAFGTGHHATTSLMLAEILKEEFLEKEILDMGCGTAVLAILSIMRGAKKATAIDIDVWAYENALENIKLNKTDNIDVKHGAAELLTKTEQYDIVFANINRNILLSDMAVYVASLKKNGNLYMSGFYTKDIPAIRAEAERLGLSFLHHNEKNNWVSVKFVK